MLQWLGVNLLLLSGAYLLGSFPTGYLLARWLKGIDIREQGSGSTGATNVLRILGKGPGAFVLAVDVLKGALAILGTGWAYTQPSFTSLAVANLNPLNWQPWVVVLAGLAAILGHSRPVWLNFRGGKSVATSLGLLIALDWRIALATLGIFGLTLAVTRWVSLGSILASVIVPVWFILLKLPLPYILLSIAGGLYVIWRHQSNIQRLLAGTEPRLGSSAVVTAEPAE